MTTTSLGSSPSASVLLVPPPGGGGDRLERTDGDALAVGGPRAEHGGEPVGVRGRRRSPGRRAVPGRVRQQEVDGRRLQGGECPVACHRVGADVDRAKQSRVNRPEPVSPQEADRADGLVVTAAPVGIAAVQVVGRLVAVEGDPHLDARGREQRAELLVEPHPVGLDPQVKTAATGQGATQRARDLGEYGHAGEQRLAAMQDDANQRQPVRPRVLGDALGGCRDGRRGNYRRAPAPALVGVLVDVAVITGQVAAAVHLQDKLAERQDVRGEGQVARLRN